MSCTSVLSLSPPPRPRGLDGSLSQSYASKQSPEYPKQDFERALREFEEQNPDYLADAALSALRSTEFSRLKASGTVYLDYMGGSLYPESLVTRHFELLKTGVFGNTHSDSPTSTLSESHIKAARAAVLDFFSAPPDEYVCIFTNNATGALKLVGEAYPFSNRSSYVLPADCHNSVNGIRRFAHAAGAETKYLDALCHGGFDEANMRDILVARRPLDPSTHSLLAVTGQSNVTGHRPNLSTVVPFAKLQGFDILLDAAALASSSRISLRELNCQVDAMAISFYKMFGYPTGVGALVAKKSFLAKLRKPYFSGGTVEVVQVPGTIVHESPVQCERFEEGTLNYATLPAISNGIQFLQKHLPFLPARLGTLHRHLHESLASLRYANGAPVVRVHTAGPTKMSSASPYRPLTPPATPERETNPFDIPSNAQQLNPQESTPVLGSYGYVLACTFLSPTGAVLPLPFVSRHAATSNISLRTGCVCNPGGAAALLCMQQGMEHVEELIAREGWKDDVGVVRMSLGVGSDFEDVWKVVQWAKGLTDERVLEHDLTQWKTMHSQAKHAQAQTESITMFAVALLMYFYGTLVVLFSTNI